MPALSFTRSLSRTTGTLAMAAAIFLPLSTPARQITDAAAPAVPTAGVQLQNHSFNSPDITVNVGTTVVWSNIDNDTHNVAFDSGPQLFVSPVLQPGQSVRFTFTQPGEYHYFCEWHAFMKGKITVIDANGSSVSLPPVAPLLFSQTGKSVREPFLGYWQTHGGLAQQGYPITEEMTEKSDTDGKYYRVQYFERAVFEYHPENPAPYNVLLSLLGNFRYKNKYSGAGGAPGQQPDTSQGSVLFTQTGKRLGGRFLQYWQTHGGLAQQGYPISDEFDEKSDANGKTYRVQYFERAVFEYHPENRPPFDILLSQLGTFRYSGRPAAPGNPAGIYSTGLSDGPNHYPLLAGPHAAPGVNAWIYDQNPAPVLGWVNDLGVKWVLHQLSWYHIEPQKGVYKWELIDGAVNALHAQGINLILNPVHAPEWSWATDKLGYPKDPADFARFMTAVAQRYKGKVAGYEIWNEPNFAHETGPYASTSHYAAILEAGYKAVKSVDPGAVVILGALTATGINDPFQAVDDVEFLKRLYAYNNGELKGYFDVLGAHPGSTCNPPETLWPDDPGPGPGWIDHPSFYFRRIEQLRQVMVDNGDARKQMWLTEFGWNSIPNPPAGFEYAALNSEQQQADYIATALRMGRDRYSWMGPMMVFGLNFALPSVSTDPTDERIGWSLLRRDGSKRPSYFALRDFVAGR